MELTHTPNAYGSYEDEIHKVIEEEEEEGMMEEYLAFDWRAM